MKQFQFIFLLFLVVLSTSCQTKAQPQADNKKPMYGEVEKNTAQKQSDENFIKVCINQYGNVNNAANDVIYNAWTFFYHNDLETAMKRFNQAWLLNPENPEPYFGFAALLEMQQNKIEAERFYKIALDKDKDNNRAEICYKRIADCKEQLNDMGGAIEAYEKITLINPDNVFALKKIGYLQMQSNNSDEALIAYAKAIKLDPNDATTYNNRAYLYQTNKDYSKAIADYTKAIELNPEYISAYVNRGTTEMQNSNYESAKKDFEQCVLLNSKSGELHRLLGLVKLNLNDKKGACEDFKQAKELGDKQSDELIKQNCK